MIRINYDYYIDTDGRNYILCKDYHKTEKRVMPDGREAEFRVFDTLGYYGTLSGALRGLSGILSMKKISEGEYTLSEAVEEIRKINKGLSDLLERYEDDLK